MKRKMKIRGILFCLIVSITCFFSTGTKALAAGMPDVPSQEGSGAGAPEEGTAQDAPVTGVTIDSTTLMYAVEKVNVRKGPGTDTEVMGELAQGEMVFAVELLAEGWYRIVFGGETGYVRQDFLALYGTAGAWEAPGQPSVPVISGQDSVATGKRAAGKENMSDDSGQDETLPRAAKPAKGKSKNTSAIVIIAAAVLLILGYGVFQVVKEKRENEKRNDEGDARGEEPEDEAWDAEEHIDEWADEELRDEEYVEAEETAEWEKTESFVGKNTAEWEADGNLAAEGSEWEDGEETAAAGYEEEAGETEALEEDEMVILDIDEV